MSLLFNISLLCLKSLHLFFLEAILFFISLVMPSRPSTKHNMLAVPSATLHTPLLRKCHSWPPLRSKLRANSFDESLDDDPFSHFVSDPSETSEVFLGGLTAGIDDTLRSRSYSPRYRAILLSPVITSSPTSKLKRWIEKMELRCFHRSPHSSPPVTQRPMPSPELPQPSRIPSTNSPPIRGRRDARRGSMRRVTPNGRSKPRRPRAWRAPSAEIWPVVEDNEDESVGLGIRLP